MFKANQTRKSFLASLVFSLCFLFFNIKSAEQDPSVGDGFVPTGVWVKNLGEEYQKEHLKMAQNEEVRWEDVLNKRCFAVGTCVVYYGEGREAPVLEAKHKVNEIYSHVFVSGKWLDKPLEDGNEYVLREDKETDYLCVFFELIELFDADSIANNKINRDSVKALVNKTRNKLRTSQNTLYRQEILDFLNHNFPEVQQITKSLPEKRKMVLNESELVRSCDATPNSETARAREVSHKLNKDFKAKIEKAIDTRFWFKATQGGSSFKATFGCHATDSEKSIFCYFNDTLFRDQETIKQKLENLWGPNALIVVHLHTKYDVCCDCLHIFSKYLKEWNKKISNVWGAPLPNGKTRSAENAPKVCGIASSRLEYMIPKDDMDQFHPFLKERLEKSRCVSMRGVCAVNFCKEAVPKVPLFVRLQQTGDLLSSFSKIKRYTQWVSACKIRLKSDNMSPQDKTKTADILKTFKERIKKLLFLESERIDVEQKTGQDVWKPAKNILKAIPFLERNLPLFFRSQSFTSHRSSLTPGLLIFCVENNIVIQYALKPEELYFSSGAEAQEQKPDITSTHPLLGPDVVTLRKVELLKHSWKCKDDFG